MRTPFNYTARNKDGKIEKSVIGGNNKMDAIQGLREQGLVPIEVIERGAIFDVSKLLIKRPPERLTFFRSFAALSGAGASTNDTFNLLISQIRSTVRRDLKNRLPWSRSRKMKYLRVIEGLAREVMGGTKLHDAMSRRPNDFSEVEAAMVQIGEATGDMAIVLDQVAQFLERDRKFRKQLGDALTYPSVVAGFAVIMVILIIVKIIPEFANLFAGFNVELPPTMQIMLQVSHFITNPFGFLLIIAIVIGLVVMTARSLGTPKGALAFDNFRLKIPIVGDLVTKIVVSRICRVLAMLSESGKGPLPALEIAIPVSESPAFAKAMTDAKEAIRRGQANNLHEALGRTDMFDPLVIGFAQVGAKTGNLGDMLGRVSEYFESDIASLTAMIPTFVQTLITILMGGIVGFIVYSVYGPLSQLMTQIH